MKGDKDNIRTVYASIGMIIFFLIVIISILINSDNSKEINENDLKFFKGELIYAKKESDGGLRKHYFYIFKLKGYKNDFQINGFSYNLLNKNDLNRIFQIGNIFEIATTTRELSIAKNESLKDKLLNKIFNYRDTPSIFHLKVNNVSFINIQKYNNEKKETEMGSSNWILLCLFGIIFFGLIGYGNWKIRFE